MENALIIKGLDPIKNQRLFGIVQNVMEMYRVKKIRISIKPKLNNAVLSPFGIKFGKPLLDKLSDDEVEAILAHEFSHLFNRDIFSNVLLYLIFASPFLGTLFFFYNPTNPSFSVAIMLLISIIIWIYGIRVRNWIILQNEIRADREAVMKTKKPDSLQSALIVIITEPLLRTEKSSIISVIFQSIYLLVKYFFGLSHPQLKERIEYLDFAKRILKT